MVKTRLDPRKGLDTFCAVNNGDMPVHCTVQNLPQTNHGKRRRARACVFYRLPSRESGIHFELTNPKMISAPRVRCKNLFFFMCHELLDPLNPLEVNMHRMSAIVPVDRPRSTVEKLPPPPPPNTCEPRSLIQKMNPLRMPIEAKGNTAVPACSVRGVLFRGNNQFNDETSPHLTTLSETGLRGL